MGRIIQSATIGEGAPKLQFGFGINILWEQNAEDILLTLAGIFGGMPHQNGKVEILWNANASLFVSIKDGACGVEKVITSGQNAARLVKKFHKQRFLNFRNCTHVLDGARLPAGISGASNLLLNKLRQVPATEDDRPLFVSNFLERLDEAVDLHPVFETLNATGRQVFIALPPYYPIKQLEELPYDTTIHAL